MYSDPRRPKRDPKSFQRESGSWSIIFYQRGKTPRQKWVATGIQTRYYDNWQAHVPSEVRNILTDWTRLWREGKYDPWTDDAPGKVTAKKAVEAFLAQHEGAPETLKSYQKTLEPFIATLSPDFPISSIEARHVRKYISQPQLTGGTPATYFNRLRTFFKFCATKHWTYEDPTATVARPAEPSGSSRSIFLPNELERILAATFADIIQRPERQVCMPAYELAMVTGMRVGELCSRTWADVELTRNIIRVDNQPASSFELKTKESKRAIVLFPRAKRILADLARHRISEDPAEPIFLAPRHQQRGSGFLSADWLSRRFTENRVGAGLPHGTIHSLRHTFTTYCLAIGIPESKVMAMTGHVKYDTIRRYTHIVEELLQEAPDVALSRLLPDYNTGRQPRLLRLIAAFMADQPLETEVSM